MFSSCPGRSQELGRMCPDAHSNTGLQGGTGCCLSDRWNIPAGLPIYNVPSPGPWVCKWSTLDVLTPTNGIPPHGLNWPFFLGYRKGFEPLEQESYLMDLSKAEPHVTSLPFPEAVCLYSSELVMVLLLWWNQLRRERLHFGSQFERTMSWWENHGQQQGLETPGHSVHSVRR